MRNLDQATITQLDPTYYSTRQAAKLLGLSLGTVQKMVETGVLEAWKTAGGHRRIDKSSLQDYLSRRPASSASREKHMSILVVEDDDAMQKHYESKLGAWDIPLDLAIVGDGLKGLMEATRKLPTILISDLFMKGVDGFKMIRTLRKEKAFDAMDIIVVTSLSREEIAENGGLPEDVVIFNKPVPFEALYGYVNAKLHAMARTGKFH